jgi:broad specificity phosphatase PhoE
MNQEPGTMNCFYFVRHGETDANNQGLMCGRLWNIELNKTGIAHAKEAGELLARESSLGAIWASSMIRARQTAEILNERLGLPITFYEDLEEWNVGEWDRIRWADIKAEFLGAGEPPGGESRKEFRDRVERVLTRCIQSPEVIVLVSHGGVWFVIQQILGIRPPLAANHEP